MKIVTLIAAGDDLLRALLCRRLAAQADLEICGAVAEAGEALAAAERLRPEVLVVDEGLSGMPQAELLGSLRTLPGAPDGEYVIQQYASAFENKKEAMESVVLMKEKDGTWKVVGYFIK